jgi:hypothetical protein
MAQEKAKRLLAALNRCVFDVLPYLRINGFAIAYMG